MRGGRKLTFNLLHDVFINDCLRCLARDTTGYLCQIAAAHIQLVRIEMHITIGAAEVVDLRDKLIIEFRTASLQVALTCQLYVDEILCHRQSILHLLALVQIYGKSRRETVGKTM